MTGCVARNPADLLRQLDAAVDRLVPRLVELLGQVAPDATVSATRSQGVHSIEAPLRFPDGIGRGVLTARVFRYRTQVRVDVALAHNRMIARADGQPSQQVCFLNDFSASCTLGPDADELPERFVTEVVTGAQRALAAVDDHNRRFPQPWSRIRVSVA